MIGLLLCSCLVATLAEGARGCRAHCRDAIAQCQADTAMDVACSGEDRAERTQCRRRVRAERRLCRASILASCVRSPDAAPTCGYVNSRKACDALAPEPVVTNPEWTLGLGLDTPGFFVLRGGQSYAYARRDDVYVSASGDLVDRFGLALVGQPLDAAGRPAGGPAPIVIYQFLAGRKTTRIEMAGNLASDSAVEAFDRSTLTSAYATAAMVGSVTAYDEAGQALDLTLFFAKTATDVWTVTVAIPSGLASDPLTVYGAGMLAFDETGQLSAPVEVTLSGQEANHGPLSATLRLEVTQFAQPSGFSSVEQDGDMAGPVISISIDAHGILRAGNATRTEPIYQLNVAGFAAPALLARCRDDLFAPTVGSGPPAIGVADSGPFGSVRAVGRLM